MSLNRAHHRNARREFNKQFEKRRNILRGLFTEGCEQVFGEPMRRSPLADYELKREAVRALHLQYGSINSSTKRRTKILLVAALGFALVVTFLVVIAAAPSGPKVVCNRLIDSAIHQWSLEMTNAGAFPNVDGHSRDSLALIEKYCGGSNELRNYHYVAGLQQSDPSDLILLYVNRPSRQTWHGDVHWWKQPKRWVVLPVGLGGGNELAEALTAEAFKSRLSRTIEFLKTNQRSGWTNAVAESERILGLLPE